MRRQVGTAALVLAAAGCRAGTVTDDDVVCTLEARAGIVLTVRDSATGAAVSPAGTLVIVRQGAGADTARVGAAAPPDATFPFAHERAGTYAVRVEAPGHRPWERTGVQVTADRCHVRTVRLTALLQP